MLLRGSAATTAFKCLPASVALAVMMLLGHGAVAHSSTQAEKNEQLMLTAYQCLFGDHDLTVIDKYWAKDYIQHNPYMGRRLASARGSVLDRGLLCQRSVRDGAARARREPHPRVRNVVACR